MEKVTFYEFESPLFKRRHQSYRWAGIDPKGDVYITTKYLSAQELMMLAFDGGIMAWLDKMSFVRITDILTVIDKSRHGVFLKAEQNIKESLGLLPGSNQDP